MTSRNRIVVSLAVVVLVVSVAAVAQEEDTGIQFVTKEKFDLTGPIALEGQAGDVEVRSVEFVKTTVKSGGLKGTFSSGDPEINSVLIARLHCATAAPTKRKFDIEIAFLDGDGNLIDRVRDSANLKDEAKVIEIKHMTLKWVVSHIDTVQITVTAKS